MRYFIKFNPSKKFVETLYRIEPVKRNDGTIFNSLQYRTFAGLWFHSESFGENIPKFINSEFTQEVTEAEMQEYLDKDNAVGHD